MKTDTYTQIGARIGIVLLAAALVTASAAAVSGLSVAQLTNSEVESGQSASHTLSVEANEISADGAMDTVYIQLPDEYAGNISFSSAAVVNRSSGATVPISSSTNIVDGPDGDGLRETIETGISKDADYQTDNINATYQFGLSHPPVMETTSYDVTLMLVDSETGNATTTVEDAITVQAGGEMMTTASSDDSMDDSDSMETTESMDGDSGSMDTTESMDGDSMESNDDTGGEETTSGSGPGFGSVLAALGVLTGVALLARRS